MSQGRKSMSLQITLFSSELKERNIDFHIRKKSDIIDKQWKHLHCRNSRNPHTMRRYINMLVLNKIKLADGAELNKPIQRMQGAVSTALPWLKHDRF